MRGMKSNYFAQHYNILNGQGYALVGYLLHGLHSAFFDEVFLIRIQKCLQVNLRAMINMV